MQRAIRVIALAFLLTTALAVLLSGVALAAPQPGVREPGNPAPIVQTSLSVQPDLCLGNVVVSISYDGGRHWSSFLEAPVRGDPTNCDVKSLKPPYFSQSSATWIALPADKEREASSAKKDEGSATSTASADWPGKPDDESQMVQLLQSSENGGLTTATLTTTTAEHPQESESYWAQVQWHGDDAVLHDDYVELSFGSNRTDRRNR